MDSSAKKVKNWRGELVSETRYYVNTWLETQLPLLSGKVLNVGAGNSPLPKKLLNFQKVSKYTTFDKKFYGDSKNEVDVRGDIENMPTEWTNAWDSAITIEVLECVPNLFKAMDELHRVLKLGGILLITCPFNVAFFGYGSSENSLKKQHPVKDYWRPTKNAWELLLSKFSSYNIEGFGGTSEADRYVYCIRAIK